MMVKITEYCSMGCKQNNIINASCKQCNQHIDINFSALKQY